MALIPKSQREQWRAELEAATPGPWRVETVSYDADRVDGIYGPERYEDYGLGPERADTRIVETDSGVYPPEMNDARLIASAPTAISALLAENDELRRMVREACGIAGVLAIELRACYAELGEEYDMGDDERIAELAREVGE